MALVKSSVGVLSGSIGADTYSHNRYGTYIRRRATPTNPNTGKQSRVRGNLSTASQTWRSLTTAQKQAWKDYASQTPFTNRVGDEIYLTGHACYVKYAVFYLEASVSPPTDPPATPGLAYPPSLNYLVIDATTPALTTTITAGWGTDMKFADDANAILAMWISPALSAGVSYFNGPWQRIVTPTQGLIAGLALPSDPIPITSPPYVGSFGNGERRILIARQLDGVTGKLSPMSKSEIFETVI